MDAIQAPDEAGKVMTGSVADSHPERPVAEEGTSKEAKPAKVESPPMELELPEPLPPDHPVFRSMRETTWVFWLLVGFCLVGMAVAAYAWFTQLRDGLIVTNLSDHVPWGLYISGFVFFIGVSYAGTLVSAILRITQAEWRRPITRLAEAVTVFALAIGASYPLLDMGQPIRLWHMMLYGHVESALLWDFMAIMTYLVGSCLYFYIPLIPDLATCRDRMPDAPGWQRLLFRIGALGWRGHPRQKQALDRATAVMMIGIIPVAVSAHTVVSWIFATTLNPGWNSALMGPVFVAGAIFSGLAVIILVMAVFRWAYGLEDYLKPIHFRYLAYILLTMDLIMIYFTINEYLVHGYGAYANHEVFIIGEKFHGTYSFMFWTMAITSFVIPAALIIFPWTRNIWGICVASVSVIIGMFLERVLIIVPTLEAEGLLHGATLYWPSWQEYAITFGGGFVLVLCFLVFPKIIPVISTYETKEHREWAKPKVP